MPFTFVETYCAAVVVVVAAADLATFYYRTSWLTRTLVRLTQNLLLKRFTIYVWLCVTLFLHGFQLLLLHIFCFMFALWYLLDCQHLVIKCGITTHTHTHTFALMVFSTPSGKMFPHVRQWMTALELRVLTKGLRKRSKKL